MDEHRYPSPLPFQGLDPAATATATVGAGGDPLGGQMFVEDVRTHIPRAWAVDDDEDYADAEVRWISPLRLCREPLVVVAAAGDGGRIFEFFFFFIFSCCRLLFSRSRALRRHAVASLAFEK